MRKTQLVLICSVLSINVSSIYAADTAAGAQKAQVCFGCHGQEGNSSSGTFPNLAGQTTAYLVKQLQTFRNGERVNAMMNGMAKDLSDADIANLAAYFSSRKTISAGGDANLAKQGANQATHCLGCHGNNAQGNGQFPKLAGQHSAYLSNQLQNFKSGQRKNSTMQAMANNLSASDIAQLTAYFANLK